MAENHQLEFYISILDTIAEQNGLDVHGNISGDRWVFSNPETGRIALNVDVYQWWDDLRAAIGADEAYITVIGL